jgi:DNA-binding GntR family transcriptional regulator
MTKEDAIRAVLEHPRLSKTQALVLIGLILRSDAEYGNAYPSQSALAAYARVGRLATVAEALEALIQMGLVACERREGRSSVFTVLPENLLLQPPA